MIRYIMPPVPVWPEGLIYIAGNVISVQASLEEAPCVAHKALTGLYSDIVTSFFHGLEQWDLGVWVAFVHFPPPS